MKQGTKKKVTVKKILVILLLILGLAAVIGLFVFLYMRSQPKETIYEIVEVKTSDIANSTVATGKVSPRDEILIKPQISGIVTHVLKEAGESVKTGEVIAKIQVVPESSSLSSAESQLNISKISLGLTTSEYNRQKELFAKGVIAKEEMEQAETNYQKALEDVDNAQDNLDIVKTGVSRKTAQYSNTQVKSTIDGVLLDVPIKVGNSVIQTNNFNEGTTIASVANMSDMLFIGKVDETEVGRIHTGMPIKLSIGAIENKTFDAVLEYVAPQGVEENGAILFEIKAAVQLTDSIELRAGYSANAQVILSSVKNVMTIPEGSITFSNDSAYVYVVKQTTPKQIFEKRPVTLGLSDGINIEIKSGLKKGEKIRGNALNNEDK